MPGIFRGEGFGNYPQAELLVLQSSFAVIDESFKEICSGLVEEAKVCTPRHVADDIEPGSPHLGAHRGYLPNSILENGLKQA
jgi:hypothetical protein